MPWDKTDKRFSLHLFFTILLLLAGISWVIYRGIDSYIRVRKVSSWITIPCVINEVHPDFDARRGSDDALFYWRIWYTYEYKDQNYRTNGFNIIKDEYIYLTEQEKQQLNVNPYNIPRGPYKAGENAFCYVNPKNPAQAVLNREYTTKSFFRPMFGPMLLLFVGIIVLVMFIQKYHY